MLPLFQEQKYLYQAYSINTKIIINFKYIKRMKNFKLLLILATLAFVFTSCDDESSIDGHDITGSSRIVGWSSPIVTESYFTDLGTINKNYPIDVLGGGDGSPTTQDISFAISVNTAETTATNGEYTLNATSAIISAGDTFGNLSIGINTPNFSPTAPTKLVLDLETSVAGVVVSSLAKQMTINFVGCQSEVGNHTYQVTTVREDGNTKDRGVEVIITDSVNSFWTKSVGVWGTNVYLNGVSAESRGVKFTDICGTLTIPKHSLGDHYSNEVGGLSTTTVDEDGNFKLKYYIMFDGEPTNYTSTYTKQ